MKALNDPSWWLKNDLDIDAEAWSGLVKLYNHAEYGAIFEHLSARSLLDRHEQILEGLAVADWGRCGYTRDEALIKVNAGGRGRKKAE